jgi:hypothetical protein
VLSKGGHSCYNKQCCVWVHVEHSPLQVEFTRGLAGSAIAAAAAANFTVLCKSVTQDQLGKHGMSSSSATCTSYACSCSPIIQSIAPCRLLCFPCQSTAADSAGDQLQFRAPNTQATASYMASAGTIQVCQGARPSHLSGTSGCTCGWRQSQGHSAGLQSQCNIWTRPCGNMQRLLHLQPWPVEGREWRAAEERA